MKLEQIKTKGFEKIYKEDLIDLIKGLNNEVYFIGNKTDLNGFEVLVR